MKAKDNDIKVSLDKVNLSDDASRRILNNILQTKHKKNNIQKWSFACVTAVIAFFIVFEGTLFCNKTNSFLTDMHDLSEEYDNNIIGSIYEYENDDILFRIEECFNELNEITLFISTKFKKIDASIDMDFLKLKTHTGNIPIYMSCNCNVKDNTLYTILTIQKSASCSEMFLCFDNFYDNSEHIIFPLEVTDIETKNIACGSYNIDDEFTLNNIIISQYGLYFKLNAANNDSLKKNKNLFSVFEDHDIAIKLTSNKVVNVKNEIKDISMFTNYMSKQDSGESYIIKYPFKDVINLNEVKSIIIDKKVFELN